MIPVTVPAPLVREHLDHILRSAAFAKADRLRAFLRFIVDKTLAGDQDAIKEYAIALDVCGRSPSFDARIDPIVRVDANRLRARLDAYYNLEGRDQAVRIHLPKGSYVPAIAAVSSEVRPPGAAALAVLPFVDLGPHRDDDSFVDGLTEELIHQLSRHQGLRVIARTSAFQYRGKGGDVRRIAGDLGVDHLLEGSVRWAGDQIRVTVQLTEVESCSVRWSERYERHLSDVFAVQDDICRNIATALRVQLVDVAPLPQRMTVDPRAHVEYLKGRHFWNRRTADSLARSLAHYQRALDLDPRCASAHCGIADTRLVQALNEQLEAGAALVEARAHAQRATELAPDLAEAWTSAAAVASVLEWNWREGDLRFRRAIELNPGFSLAHYLRAIVNLAPQAKWGDALIEMDRALELDPVSPVLHRDLGILHYLRGEYRDAEEALQAAVTLDAAFQGSLFWLGRTYVEQGRLDEALAMFEARWEEPSANTRVLASLVHTLSVMGRRSEARQRFDQLREHGGRVPSLNLAIAYLGLGQHDQAMTHIERAHAERAVPLYQLAVDPVYAPVRETGRVQAILEKMKLDPASVAGS
jgi:serine/threonine-protein kinase